MKNYYPAAVDAADMLIQQQTIRRIWDRDVSVWGAASGSADAKSIQTRLGWLDVAHTTASELGRVHALANAVKADGIRTVYLFGMGGSGLCAEVMAAVFGVGKYYPRLVVLDTTDERTITTAAQQ